MEIIFAGGSHYEINGFNSIKQYFNRIYVLDENAENIKPLMRGEDSLISNFEECNCKYVFLCGYAKLIKEKQLKEKTFINVHGALLPKYRGMHSTFYAIMNGEKELGITFHLVDEYMDSGDILAQFSFKYTGQIVSEINNQIDNFVGKHAGHVCKDFIEGKICPQVQNHENAVYGAKRNLNDCFIDFNMPNKYLRRFFKALTPSYPQPMLNIREKRYEVIGKYDIRDCDYFGPLGRAVNISDEGVWIKIAEGYLIVDELRDYETKKVHKAAKLIPIGYRFNNP